MMEEARKRWSREGSFSGGRRYWSNGFREALWMDSGRAFWMAVRSCSVSVEGSPWRR